MRRSWPLCAIVTGVFVAVSASIAVAAPAASLGEAKNAFSSGEYRQCLQIVARALSGPDGKAGSSQRYDLLMLRGESMLRLGQFRLASDAFKSASDVAKSKQDRRRMADAMATGLLLNAVRGKGYTPAGAAASPPIDVVEPESRKKAMEALYADSLAASQSKIQKAASGQSVEAIREMIPKMRDLYAIELAATGEATTTLPLARSLGQRARDLVGAEFKRIDGRLDELSSSADSPVILEGRGGLSDVLVGRGLTTQERDELQAIANSLTQCERAAQQGRWIARNSDGPAEAWESMLADCSELKERAEDLWGRATGGHP